MTLPNLGSTVAALNQTIALINRPEGAKDAKGKILPPGTIAVANKAITKAGDAVVTGQLSLQAIAPAIQTTAAIFETIAPHANTALDGVSETASTASTSLQMISAHVTPVLDATKSTIADVGTAINTQNAALSKSQTDFQDVLTGFTPVEKNLGTITDNFGAMSTTANAKFQAFMNPPPCRDWKCHIGQTIEIMKTASSFIEPAMYLKDMFGGQQIYGTVTVQSKR